MFRLDTYDHSGYSARRTSYQLLVRVKPPGTRQANDVCETTQSGLCWSMNCDNWRTKNSLIAAVTGRMLVVVVSRHRYLVQTSVRERFVPSKVKTHLVGSISPTARIGSFQGGRYHPRDQYLLQGSRNGSFLQDVSWSYNPYFVRWVSISDDGDNGLSVRSDNFEFCNSLVSVKTAASFGM